MYLSRTTSAASSPPLAWPRPANASLRTSPRIRRARAWVHRWLHRTRIVRTGIGHTVQLEDSLLERCRFEISGQFNRLDIGRGARLWDVKLRLHGENLHCHIGAGCRLRGATLVVEDRGSTLLVGDGTTMIQPVIVVSEGGTVRIGADCLIAYGTDIRNSDGHSLLDETTIERINPAADIRIDDHVWLGLHSEILKGVRIGAGAAIAARSVVTRDIPPRTIAAGIPAKVLRTDIHWDHRRL